MGVVGTSAGNEQVSVSGLSADVVKKGSTVTIKQGSRVVQQVVGSYAQSADSPCGYGFLNGAGYSEKSGYGKSLDTKYFDGRKILVPGYYKVIIQGDGNGWPRVNTPWGTINGEFELTTKEGQLKAGDEFSMSVDRSNGNGNGTGAVTFLLLHRAT